MIKTKFQSYILIIYLIILNSLLICNIKTQKVIPKITIYMESLCPYCIEFITTSIKEFYTKVTKPNVADIEIIPYGNANEIYDPTTKKYLFTCQHGDNECYGNLILTCSINILGRIRGQLNLICILDNIYKNNRDFDLTLEECLSSDTESLQEIKDCVKSDIGNQYQHQMAEKTLDHLGVPWILVDGIYDEETNDKIWESLIDYLCGDDKSKCY